MKMMRLTDPSAHGHSVAVGGLLRTITNKESLFVVFLSGDAGEGSAGPSIVALRFPRAEGLGGPPCPISCMSDFRLGLERKLRIYM